MDHIFFITKVAPIYYVVFPLLETIQNKEDILIIAGSKEVSSFFKNHTDFRVISMQVHPNLITRKNKYKLLKNILLSKKEYKTLFKKTKDAKIYFFGSSFKIVVFSYLHKLARKNTIIKGYASHKKTSIEYPLDHSMRAWMMRWIAKWLLGVETTVHINQGAPFWKLSETFYEKHHIRKMFIDHEKTNKNYPIHLDVLKGKTVLITMQDLMVYNYVEKASFVKILDDLMALLYQLYPDKFVIKPHPREDTLYGAMATTDQVIPPYIPSEFLMDHPWDIVIGIFSTSLLSAARLTKAKVISIIDLLRWNDTAFQQKWSTIMKDAGVLVPKTVKELSQLLQEA
jgi:hypothetical protein